MSKVLIDIDDEALDRAEGPQGLTA